MDPQIPTSFIPKRPLVTETVAPEHRSRMVGLLSIITGIVIVATIISFVGVFLYEKSLSSQKVKLTKSIDDAKSGIGTDFLQDMQRLNTRINGVKVLLQNHVVVSPIFAALEETTLHSIQYKSFTYEMKTDPVTKTPLVGVKLEGTAKTYSSIALQSDAFAQSPIIKNPVFSSLVVEDKTNSVGFHLAFDVNPSDLAFQTFIDAKIKSGARTSAAAESEPVAPAQQPKTP